MFSSLLSWTALGIHFPMKWILFKSYLTCLVHCVQFDSFDECERNTMDNLLGSAFYAVSGFLWIFGNSRQYHILYYWLLITAQLIGLTFTFLGYARKLKDYTLWQPTLVLPGFLVTSFVCVILHLLVAKDLIRNRWIKGFIIFCISPTGKIG